MNDLHKFLNLDIAEQALNGDENAVRIFCGSYDLYQNPFDKKYYRVKGNAPSLWRRVKGVHDKDGFLLSSYWINPRFLG